MSLLSSYSAVFKYNAVQKNDSVKESLGIDVSSPAVSAIEWCHDSAIKLTADI